MKCIVFLFLLLPALFSAAQDRSQWFEFYLPWNDSTQTITDMSAYLDPPAGKYGFVQVTPDGHFKFENNNENLRFVGVVNVATGNFPSKVEAPILAARMAKFGINLVRIHLMDVDWQHGLFLNSANNTLQLDPVRLDKMDYFIKCLKDKGIYFNFCIHAGRMFKPNDGIDAPVSNDQSKYITLFNQKLIDLQKDFAAKTIGHINPYTGLTYANDPAMANMELTNENSLFNGWMGWQSDYLFEENPEGIGSFYARELDTLFNNWLKEKYQTGEVLKEAWSGSAGVSATELVKNGSFEQNLTNWGSLVTGGAQGKISADSENSLDGSKSVKIVVSSPGTEHWHVQLKTNEFKVEKHKAYKISFYAKASKDDDLRLEVMENSTWKWIMGPFYKTGTDWKKYEVFFNAPFDSERLIVAFEWGKQTGTYYLDSVSITETAGVGLEEGESLAAGSVKRTMNQQIGKYSKERIGDNAAFYFHIEKSYTEGMIDYLKNELEVKCPVTFTNNYFGLASIYSQAQADYIDFHQYWDHPNYPNGWSDINFTLRNKSMMLDPAGSTINRMMLSKVKNMPLVLSEYNHAYPYIYQVEAPSLLYAYGSFFDLDGIIWHAYYDYMNNYSQRHQDMFFDIAMNPVVMTQLLLAVPYRMRSLQKATTFAEGFYREEDLFRNTKIYQDDDVINLPGAEYGTSFLQHGFRHASFDADSSFLTGTFARPGKVVTSETGELMWDGEQGYFTVDNPYWQGATGYLGNKTIELGDIILSGVETTDNLNFASVHLISLDSLPIDQSKRLVLLTSARLENEGLRWNATQTSLLSKGGIRALCEPVGAVIQFKGASADSIRFYSLNERGARADSLPVDQKENAIQVSLSQKTLWYEISNHKFHGIVQDSRRIKNINPLMKIYPNPGNDYLNVEFSLPGSSNAHFVMYNSTGRMIRNDRIDSQESGSRSLQINLHNLKSGIYYCGFLLPDGSNMMEKLVVSR